MEIIDIVKKLIGPIEPVGASHIDPKRQDNLKKMIELSWKIIAEIMEVSKEKDRQEYSIKVIGKEANMFLLSLYEELKEYFYEGE